MISLTVVASTRVSISREYASEKSANLFTKMEHNRNRVVTRAVNTIAMDIDALHSALLSIAVVSEKLRSARELFPATENFPDGLGRLLYERGDWSMDAERSSARAIACPVPALRDLENGASLRPFDGCHTIHK